MEQNLSIFEITNFFRNVENSSPFLLLMIITRLLPGSFPAPAISGFYFV